jgi:hypothetical protein
MAKSKTIEKDYKKMNTYEVEEVEEMVRRRASSSVESSTSGDSSDDDDEEEVEEFDDDDDDEEREEEEEESSEEEGKELEAAVAAEERDEEEMLVLTPDLVLGDVDDDEGFSDGDSVDVDDYDHGDDLVPAIEGSPSGRPMTVPARHMKHKLKKRKSLACLAPCAACAQRTRRCVVVAVLAPVVLVRVCWRTFWRWRRGLWLRKKKAPPSKRPFDDLFADQETVSE